MEGMNSCDERVHTFFQSFFFASFLFQDIMTQCHVTVCHSLEGV